MKWYMDMKIAAKLITGFVVVAIIAGILGFVGMCDIQAIDENGNTMYENMVIPLEHAADMAKLFQRVRLNTRDMIMEEDAEDIAKIYENIMDIAAEFNETIASFEELALSQEENDALAHFAETRVAYTSLLEEHYDLCIQNMDDEAYALLQGEMRIAADAEQEAIDALVSLKVAAAGEKNSENHSAAQSSLMKMLMLVIFAVVMAIGLGVIIARIISKPLGQMVEAANQISEGNLDVAISLESKDEIGSLAQAFRNMTEKINTVMTNINSASEQVAAGSMQVSDSSISLSQGATEQASSIEELTASIEEIASQAKHNAENSETAEEMAAQARDIAEKGNKQMVDMLNAMTEINDSSNSISKIIKVIDDIAFQTNILALNAAVEAARAGAHGKGFAVVAEEVRNLAARSANAAKETTSMIEESIQKVGVGTKYANETAEALEQIVEGAQQSNQLIGQIASASQEQSQGIAQINQGIAQISEVVQTTSATSEETAAASEELSSQADMLKSQVATFTLRRNVGVMDSKSESINPEVLKMLENLNESEEPQKEIKNAKKISLSDCEFEKY